VPARREHLTRGWEEIADYALSWAERHAALPNASPDVAPDAAPALHLSDVLARQGATSPP
jgi:hypothetical protein